MEFSVKSTFGFSWIASFLLFALVTGMLALPAWAAPPPPNGLTALTGNGEASLTWNASSGATWYVLYRGAASGGSYSFVAQTRGTSHTDRGLSNGAPCYYVVTALDASGQSLFSAEAAVTPVTAVLPAPAGVEVIAGNGQATLTWTPVTSAVSYKVYRATAQGGPYTLLAPSAPGPSFTDSGLANGTRYYYVVQTLSPTGGAYSDEVSVLPSVQLPVAPTGLTATPGSTWARLNWSASAGATGYAVFRSTKTGGPYAYAGYSPTTSYEETGLENGVTYYYAVAAVNAMGQGAYSAESSAAVNELQPPHAPVLRANLADGGQIWLNWDNPAGAVSYRLYRSTTSGGPYTDLGIRTSGYLDTGLTNGTTYYYVLDALNGSPNPARSNQVSLAPVAGGVPATPANVAVRPGNTQATVTWDPVPGVGSYYVAVSTYAGGPDLSPSSYYNGPSCTVTGLTNGQTYYFRVRAAANSLSPFSGDVSAAPSSSLPLAPTNPSVIGGNSQLSFTWISVAGATSYQVYRRSGGGTWSPLATTTGTLFTDNTGLTNGTTYYYLVAAVNGTGSGAWSQENSGTPRGAGYSPAPLNVAVIPGNTQATVTWDPVPGASSYNVVVSTSPGGPDIYAGGYSAGPGRTITGLTNGQTYYFRVQAGTMGWSAFSAEVSAALSASLPLAPTGTGIFGGNGQLSVTWSPVTGATGYRVYRRTKGGPWPATPTGTSTGTLFADTGLVNGVTYYYLVQAVNASGSGAWSYEADATSRATVTTAPANIAAIAGNNQTTVTWDPVAGASSYTVIVATSPGGPGISYSGYFSGPGYTVTGLTNGQTYYFRVQAGSNSWSAFSAEVSAIPSVSRLQAPTGLYVTTGNTQLTLNWTAVPGASSYQVFRRTAGSGWPATPVATPASNSYVDTGLTNGLIYYYVVATGTGAWSSEASGTPADIVPPDTTITAAPADPSTSISATFSFSSTEAGSTFRCRLDGSAEEACVSPKTYTGLSAGSHTFQVAATDNAGNTDPTPASRTWTINTSITVPTGTITINNGATVTDTAAVTLSLSCTDPDGCSQMQLSNDGAGWSTAEAYATTKQWTLTTGDGIKTVDVKFKDATGQWSNPFSDTITLDTAPKTLIINRTGSGTGTVTSSPAGITCGAVCQNSFATSAQVTLTAAANAGSAFVAWGGDCSGIEPSTVIVVKKTEICTAQFDNTSPVPVAPTGLTAITGNAEATVSWNRPAGANWFLLFRGTASGGPYSFVAQTRGISHTDHGLGNDTPYYYVVAAVNASGQSPFSAQAAVTPITAVLPAPTGVKAIAGNGQATLTWNVVTSEVVYNVYRASTQGGPYTLLTPSAPGPSFTDTGLVNGTRYYYVVQTLSTNPGAYSDEVSVVPSAQLPPRPASVTVSPGSTWARLNWSASAGATGYAVYRATAVGGPYAYAGFSPTTSYEETGLQNGVTYYYVVAAVNANGQGAFSTERSAAVTELQMPHAPVLRASLAGSGEIYLSWDNSAGAVSYQLYRATTSGGPYTTDLGIHANGYLDTGLTNGSTYYYVVDALNSSPTAVRSNQVSLAPVSGGVPPVPANIAARPGNTQATVTWNPIAGATDYHVTVATSPGGTDIYPSNYCAGPSCTFTGLTNGQTYYFRVQASANAWSSFSTEVSAVPSSTLLPAPGNLGLFGGNSELSPTWNRMTGATGYQVYRRAEGEAWPATPVGTPTGTLFNDSGLTNGITYHYLVAAVNSGGSGAWSYRVLATPAAAGMTLAPTDVAVVPGNTQATLAWNPVPGATSYGVTVATSPGGLAVDVGTSFSGPSCTVTGLTNGQTYYFRVQAGGSGWSAYSAEVSAIPSANLPMAPVDLNLIGGNGELSLTWAKVPGATSYRIYRRIDGEPWPATHMGTATGTLFTDSGLINNTTYHYQVAAVNAAGLGARLYEQYNNPRAAGVTTAPVKVAVVPGNAQATVSWDPVPGASSFSVTVATSPGGPGISYSGYFSGPGYTVTGLTNGQTYYFRVLAGAAGWSAYSAEVSAAPTASRPQAPTGLSITSGIGVLTVNWNTVAGATEYKVYRRTEGTVFILVGSTLTSSFTDAGLTNGTTYFYVVTAVNHSGPGAWSNEASGVPLDAPLYSLSIVINGSGSIHNIDPPPSFSCALASCSDTYTAGTSFLLRAVPSALYAFAGWSGVCDGTGDCALTLSGNTTVTANFTPLPLVRVNGGPTPYYSLQAAYDAATGDAVFATRDTTFADFTLDRSIKVDLNGGLDADFTTVTGYTTIDGNLNIQRGSLMVDRLVIQ